MNEQIRQLILKAGGRNNYSFSEKQPWKFTEAEVEKFAKLIIHECANHCDLLLDHKISSEWSRGTHDCSRAIKKHFGVEE